MWVGMLYVMCVMGLLELQITSNIWVIYASVKYFKINLNSCPASFSICTAKSNVFYAVECFLMSYDTTMCSSYFPAFNNYTTSVSSESPVKPGVGVLVERHGEMNSLHDTALFTLHACHTLDACCGSSKSPLEAVKSHVWSERLSAACSTFHLHCGRSALRYFTGVDDDRRDCVAARVTVTERRLVPLPQPLVLALIPLPFDLKSVARWDRRECRLSGAASLPPVNSGPTEPRNSSADMFYHEAEPPALTRVHGESKSSGLMHPDSRSRPSLNTYENTPLCALYE